jgi:hypothetical protein
MAKKHVGQAGLLPRVTFKEGDAHQVLAALEGPFDFVLLTADKGGQVDYFNKLFPKKLLPGGLLLGFFTDGEFQCNPLISCCFRDGSCLLLADFICAERGGTGIGDSTCEPNPCAPIPGLCCLSDPEECMLLTLEECAARTGVFQGVGGECLPGACVSGLCCLDAYECEILTAFECIERKGIAHYPSVRDVEMCLDYCCCPAVLDRSWGAVKRGFR